MDARVSIITLGVSDLKRSHAFYSALGFPSSYTEEQDIVFFRTSGVCVALYPMQKLAEDIGIDISDNQSPTPMMTLAHNTKAQHQVDEILDLAVKAGGTLVKPAQRVFWGGYSGYFRDPDGHYWEIAHADFWQFNEDGSLVIE
ncbi:VOC family protein [Vibrio breoganii]|uniref:VOC family protein n=1 Tax=Vibrio breoganii TaxID=553239 RepID=UPI000C83FA0E|nr:VOC family protein [Vibrio breoganii]PMF79402.1 glyoxalase [Vibrio breoganii]PMH16720.1 glyoxalase [Vibrio breoganii]PMM16304.1 glyoxalase [Vibrio breoganii]TKG23737.1 VOC family protein [Vibrio breoganii]